MAKSNIKKASRPQQAFDCLAVSEVRIFPLNEGPKTNFDLSFFPFIERPIFRHIKALAQVVLNDQLLIRGVRICEGENGLYISYPFPFHPSTGEDEPRNFVFPITKMLRDHVEAVVQEKYQDAVKKEKWIAGNRK